MARESLIVVDWLSVKCGFVVRGQWGKLGALKEEPVNVDGCGKVGGRG